MSVRLVPGLEHGFEHRRPRQRQVAAIVATATHGEKASFGMGVGERAQALGSLAMGGGGYNRRNLALAWTAVLESMIKAEDEAD